jgi:peroxiredoxin
LLFALLAAPAASPPPGATRPLGSVGKTVKAFTLEEAGGKKWSLADARRAKAVVVVFLGTECPVNNQYLPRLAQLHQSYAGKGVVWVGVNSNAHDTPTKVAGHARANGLPFAVLKDSGNVVADDFGARRTPEAFVLSGAGKVLYQGRIDDQIGIGFKRQAPTRRDLAAALDEVLAGKAVSKPLTDPPGCLIARAIRPKEKGSITWTKHVSRVVQNRCQECHRAGQPGPMPLVSYEDALSWSGMIREVVSEKRMPPWHADPQHGSFSNDRSLSRQEREALLGWVEQGCPRGDAADAPPPRKWAEGWTIGKPDVVFTMPKAFAVPAEAGKNGVSYKYFTVGTQFKEDRWVQAAECRPGAREVVHHIIVYVVDPAKKGRDRRGGDPRDGIGNGFLVAYAPGDMPLVLPPGHAKKIPKGAVLVFQMHYTPDGVARTDRSSVGLVFSKQPPKYEVRTRGVAQRFFWLLPNKKDQEVVSRSTFERGAELMGMMPHMHLRGQDFRYTAVYPDGKRQTLLVVPKYDFNWQSNYRLKKPLKLPAGTRIECVAHFDNSEDNPNNPNAKKVVAWGDQTWEEMMIGFVDYAVPVGDARK